MVALAAFAVFLAGGVGLASAVRWWRPDLAWRDAALYIALTTAFFCQPLLGGRLQVATDLAYEVAPWNEALASPVGPQNRLLWDTLVEQVPLHTQVRRRLLAGELPLWSHELGTGQPLLGDAQSAPFAPLHLLALPLPVVRALSVSAAWGILLFLLFVHVLALALGARRPGAILAAVAGGFSTYAVVWAYDTPGMTSAWVPGVLLGVVALARGERRSFAGLVACALGLAASGHPETMAFCACAAFVVALAAARGFPAAAAGRFAVRLAGAALLSGALAAPILLPVAEALPGSERLDLARRDPTAVRPPAFEAGLLAPLVEPFYFGSPRDDNWQGPSNFSEVCSEYVGLVTLALALAGGLVFGGVIRVLLLGGSVALLIALGVHPFFDLVTFLPLFKFAVLLRLRLYFVLAVALAAGLTLSRLAGSPAARQATAVLAAGLGLTAALLAPPPVSWQRFAWLVALAVAAGSALLLARLRSQAVPRWTAWALIGGVALDLFAAGVRYQAAVPAELDLAPPPALRYLMARMQAAQEPFRVLARGYDLLPSLGAVYGLWDPRGNDPMRPAAPFRLLLRRLAHGKDLPQIVLFSGHRFDRLDQGILDFLGVRFVLLRHRKSLPEPWRIAFDGTGGRIWENPEALPLFFMPRHFRWLAEQADAAREVEALDDFAELGYGVDPGARRPREDPPRSGAVPEIRPKSNGFDLRSVSATGGMMASSVSYDRGWRVRIDGRAAPVLEVDGGFLGFAVPAGAHEVRLDYRPPRWSLGLALFGLGAATAAAVAAASFRAEAARRARLSSAGEGPALSAGASRIASAP
jgi:hypothetical protein